MTIADARREWSMMASVNTVIDALHSSLGLPDTDFFCECGHIGCKEQITLTRAEYADLRARDQPVLVAAHAEDQRGVPAELHEARARESFLSA